MTISETERMLLKRVEPLLELIRKVEARDDYDIVWLGIKPKDRPPRPLTQMKIKEVLAWQDSIDPYYRSEAAGAYQILEDTLRDFYRSAGLTGEDLFNKQNQDRIALALLRRRGLVGFLSGQLDKNAFGNNLAKEWASFPVFTGAHRGKSYYSKDGLNKALVTVEAVDKALNQVYKTIVIEPDSEPKTDWLSGLVSVILSIFRRKSSGNS